MNAKAHFPFSGWIIRKLTGRWARRTYIAILLAVLCLTTVARLRSYSMARRIHAVLHGLAEIRIDQTTEEQLAKTVPYLTRSKNDWKAGGIVQRQYYTEISNESDFEAFTFMAYVPSWLRAPLDSFAYWLGYRYLSFGASAFVQDGKVSQVRYGLAKHWVRPRAVGYLVSARSVHGFWLPYHQPVEVTSQDDESPQYRVVQRGVPSLTENVKGLDVTFTNDAPPLLTKRAFQLNLSCFWSLRGCGDAREVAPGLWQDAEAIQAATIRRLRTGKCPDSAIEGRMRYLPDLSVFLLQVTGSRRIEVAEEGYKAEDWFMDYELKETIRGRSFGSWKNNRFRRWIPSPTDPMQRIANPVRPQTKAGSQVLFFGNMKFDSCQIVPATPSALEIVRKSPVPQRRPEDQIVRGLL